ncbi:MAG: hypothetical protein OEZ14_09495 [Acidimicrobiia bacterium]|nr:hypothetical protein [Acidimicrobiia bacterium]MDH5520752.1 hypothetical protein [Acidimicrobiia bacterium]
MTTMQTEHDQAGREFDIVRWLVVVLIALSALIVLNLARTRVVAPFDDLVTEQLCLRHGEDIERTLLDFERSNRFALRNRTDGFCSYGPGPEGEPAVAMSIADTEPGPLFTWAKAIGIILQLGIASIFIRLVTEPALETSRFLVERFRS